MLGLLYRRYFMLMLTPSHSSRSVNPLSLTRPFAKHNYYLYSYFPSTISFWNSLPYHIAALPFNSFKSALDNYVYM